MKTTIQFIITLLTITFFSSTLQADVQFSEKIGLTKGKAFLLPQSRTGILSVCRIKKISIKHGAYVESIRVEWLNKNGSSSTQSIGGEKTRTTWSHLYLAKDEYIVFVKAASGKFITQLTLYTNKRRKFGPFGNAAGKEFSFKLPRNSRVIGFAGNSDQAISKLGLIYETEATTCYDRDERNRQRQAEIERQRRAERLAEIERQRRIEEARKKRTDKNTKVRDHRTKENTNVHDHRTKVKPKVRDHRKSADKKKSSKKKSNVTWDPQKAGG